MNAIVVVGRSLLAAVMTISATSMVVAAGGTSAAAAVQATYYVAPDGDDTDPGRSRHRSGLCNTRGTWCVRSMRT